MMIRAPRLIDLHCDWPLQYAEETTVFDPALYAGVAARRGQIDGYLTKVRASVIACYRRAEEWARQADPWHALGELIARVEAEFSGRLLIGPADIERWRTEFTSENEPEALCWAVLGVEGCDALVRAPNDLDRLPGLFERGVRVFQPAYGASNVLAGSSAEGDDRGLTDLGRAFLQTLADLGPTTTGPTPILDLAHLNPSAMADVLGWFEADTDRPRRLIPVYSHGALAHEDFADPRALTRANLGRLRAIGGTVGFSVGPPFYASADQLQAGIESAAALLFEGRAGFEGLAIGTDFLGVDQTAPGLANATEVITWLGATFPPATALALTTDNARRLLGRAAGVLS